MLYQTYLLVNIDNLLLNLNNLKDKYSYSYYIIDVSNNAFKLGMYIINYLNIDNIYLYVNNFNDLLLVRKYNKDIPVIYSGLINDNIYDLIVNNAILLVKDINILNNIKDNINIMLDINKDMGIYTKNNILELLDLIKINKNINLLGIISYVNKDNYEEINYLLEPLSNVLIKCLNNELDKKKIKQSNTLKLDCALYNSTLYLKSKIINIRKEVKKKKVTYLGIFPLGYLNGLPLNIKTVLINNKYYNIKNIYSEYSIIKIDEDNNYLDLNINLPIKYIFNNQEIDNYL